MFRRRGYHGTGMAQILEQSAAPRGSLYFHFPGGKQQLAVEAVTEAGRAIGRGIEAILDSSPDLGEAVGRVMDFLVADLRQSGFDHGCPVGTPAMDSSPASEQVRIACAEIFTEWLELIRSRLEAAGAPPEVAQTQALLVFSAIEGALLIARAQRDTAALEAVGNAFRASLGEYKTENKEER